MSGDEQATESVYIELSLAMGCCALVCVSLIVLQIKSIQWYSTIMQDRNIYHILIIASTREHLFLYGSYALAFLCALQCLLNHISNHFPEWYCIYGMSFCVILHEAAKTCGYGFFLERAKSALLFTKTSRIPRVLTDYILAIWISFYFILYAVLCPLTFRGKSNNPLADENIIPTACLFDEYESWVFWLSVGVEIFNSVFFVFLFAFPLLKLVAKQESLNSIIKHNIGFSSVSCLSSSLFLMYRALSRNTSLAHYLWLAGNVDLVINALCTFLMVTANRMYLQHLWQKCTAQLCCCCTSDREAQTTSSGVRDHHQNNNNISNGKEVTKTNEHTSVLAMDTLQIIALQDVSVRVEKQSRGSSTRKKEESSTAPGSLPKLTKPPTPRSDSISVKPQWHHKQVNVPQ